MSGSARTNWARLALGASHATSAFNAILIIAITLLLCWALVFWFGGADQIVPHFYYLPVTLAAMRFGHIGALLAAVMAGLLAGPFTYEDVAAGTPQEHARWITRMLFFIATGQVVALLVIPIVPSLREELRQRRVQRDIRRGLKADEFFLRYQPIIDFSQQDGCSAEALIRWQHPRRGELAPAAFLPQAEQSELICDIGRFVVDSACRQIRNWRERFPERRQQAHYVSLNVSARQLEYEDVAEQIDAALQRHQLPGEVLQVEITESCLALSGADQQLRRLKALGVRVAIDDFGTGYSALSYLSRFPVDVLKIDRALTAELEGNRAARALAQGIVQLAQSIGVTTVAEGIETAQQGELLREMGYQFGQGYHFSYPLRAEEFERFS